MQQQGLTLQQVQAMGGRISGAAPATTVPPQGGLTAEQVVAMGGKTAQTSAPAKGVEAEYDMLTRASDWLQGVFRGALKGPYKTALGLSKMAGGVPQSATLDDLAMPFSGGKQAIGEAATPAEKIGMDVEQIGEFFVPAGFVSRGTKLVEGATAASKLPAVAKTVVNTAGRAGLEAGAAGTVAAAQSGGDPATIKNTATVAAAITAALPAALKLGGDLGKKIETVLIKPTKADIENGFKAENVFKYKVGGTLEQTLQKTQAEIEQLATKAKQLRSGAPGLTAPGGQQSSVMVNVKQALGDAAKELAQNAPRNQGMNQKIEAALINELKEFDYLMRGGQMDAAGNVPVDIAHQILQGVGDRGAWVYGFKDAEAVAAEKVANAFYSKLRVGIEGAVPDGSALRAVNRSMMELIPIKQAIIRRMPVEARNQALHLSDIVSIASSNIPLAIANRALRSGRVANTLVNAAEGAEKVTAAGTRGGAGAAAQVSKDKKDEKKK